MSGSGETVPPHLTYIPSDKWNARVFQRRNITILFNSGFCGNVTLKISSLNTLGSFKPNIIVCKFKKNIAHNLNRTPVNKLLI